MIENATKKRERETSVCSHHYILTCSASVCAYTCLQLCVFLFFHEKGRMNEKIVRVERGSSGRQRALSGWKTESEREIFMHNGGSVSLLERSTLSSG